MTRARYDTESEDDLPSLSDIISEHLKDMRRADRPISDSNEQPNAPEARTLSPVKTQNGGPRARNEERRTEAQSKLFMLKLSPPKSKAASHIRLQPLAKCSETKDRSMVDSDHEQQMLRKTRATPRRQVKKVNDYGLFTNKDATVSEESEFEESIWCSPLSAMESESDYIGMDTPPRSPRRRVLSPRRLQSRTNAPDIRTLSQDRTKEPRAGTCDANKFSETGSLQIQEGRYGGRETIVSSGSDYENDPSSTLRFSPPRILKPYDSGRNERPSTPKPPQSPSKSRLVSPSKKKLRIPTPPHRPSIDAFWKADIVNEWNDQYSPEKTLGSPRKGRFFKTLESISPPASPGKSQSPNKRSRAEINARKEFENLKHGLAQDFLSELDRTITKGEVQRLSESTGGVKLIWSKTLNSTAGRANWRRETSKVRQLDGSVETIHKHHASIELAEKVIDDEHRLINVLAHEFCHLANFMVSGIKDQPHGKQFKIWGRKCTDAFVERGVEVTTKHSYQIDYKYIWLCSNDGCGIDYKRHSKSIDIARHTCGACKSMLVQIKPVPRKDACPTGYAAFVKENFAIVKADMKSSSHKEVMEMMGKKYRERKAAAELEAKAKMSNEAGLCENIDEMTKALEVVNLDD